MTLLIIADDLSGAADCAIAFASNGVHTVVSLDPAHSTGDAQVVAIDTDTRRLTPHEAGARATVACQAYLKGGQRLYKKIDSTLRGNWAAEVAALQGLVGLAIVAPAFPATGRTTVNGQVLVNGQRLENTDTWQLEHAGRSADLSVMLADAGLHSTRLSLATLRSDPAALAEHIAEIARGETQALIVDAQTGEDLRRLAQVTVGMSNELFWVGSGGLAREIALLPELLATVGPRSTPARTQRAPILVLVGSLSAVSERQCVMLQARAGLHTLTVMPQVLRDGTQHADWHLWQQRIGQYLEHGEDLLLRIGQDAAFDPAEGAVLSTALAELVRPHFHRVGGLIATGGETARAMLSAVGIGSLKLECEIEAGVAFGTPVASREGHYPGVITKAGAFGTDHALYASWLYLSDAAEPSPRTEGSVSFSASQGEQS